MLALYALFERIDQEILIEPEQQTHPEMNRELGGDIVCAFEGF